ncbi:hypothetical protein E0H75_42080 [Kribbella capetownensis]|uniref:Uncharacterized protein n=1 Tax=Kribbella capetownensis TaxID=1572659 RepID=A0A4R0IK34_9ACTN|nr:hypothetical protein [Kribbella capetownensis]TCC33851.1 hypothetical protein E0H75_42080 [Kribbella capetownensis]
MTTMTWISALLLGVAAMFLMKFTPNWLDAILIRVSALLVAGAGALGVTGWLGDAFTWLLSSFADLVNYLSKGAVGTPLMWLLSAFVGALWVGALLPERLFRYDYPDWLIFAGFPLPSLLASVPGKAGDGLQTVVLGGSHELVKFVGGWFS